MARSAAVGLVATVVDLGLLALFVHGLGIPALAANVPALLVGLAIQFVGNKYWAFRDPSPNLARQLALFSLVEIGAFALNAGMFHALVGTFGMPPLVARPMASAVVYFGFSLALWRLIFRTPAAVAARKGP